MHSEKIVLFKMLSFAYGLMVASVPLLEYAIPRCTGKLQEYYQDHLAEERGHDHMLFKDLCSFGMGPIPRYVQAASLAGLQYYLIDQEHPALLLGYMLALESESLPIPMIAQLAERHGVQLTALHHHAVHDPVHKADLENMIGRIDQPELFRRLIENKEYVTRALTGAQEWLTNLTPFHLNCR